MIDAIGHVAYLCIAVGTYAIATGAGWGWLCRIIGQLGWLCLGFHLHLTSIFFWECVFITIDTMGYVRYLKRKDRS